MKRKSEPKVIAEFGTPNGGSKAKSNAGVGVISQDELRSIRAKTEKNTKNDAVVISKNDLNRIKDATVIKTKDELINEKKLLEE